MKQDDDDDDDDPMPWTDPGTAPWYLLRSTGAVGPSSRDAR
nr:hypothetical protein [Clavibacter michiganensis]